MGPNGSGKTSLAYGLAGHPDYTTTPQSKLTLDGHDLISLSPSQRAKAGLFLAFQYPVAIPGVSVQNFLKLAFDTLHPGDKSFPSVLAFRKHLQDQAKLLGVKPTLLSRSLNDGFSGGEKKRLELLQLLVLRPKYAILDETDSGLDIDSIKLVAHVITTLVKTHHTGIILITHYQRLLEHLKPDFIHVLLKGRVVKTGGPELVNQLEHGGYQQFKPENLALKVN